MVLNQDEVQTTYHDSILSENKRYEAALLQILEVADEDWDNGQVVANIAREALDEL